VFDRSGRLIIASGTVLTEKHLRAMKIWGVNRVDVADDADGATDAVVAVDPAAVEAADARIRRLFQFNADLADHPLIRTLKEHAHARMIRQGEEDTERCPVRPDAGTEGVGADGERPTLQALAKSAKSIASPPAIHSRLTMVINHPHSSAEDIARVIGEDPGLTARLLRIANSSLYAFPAQIETVSGAVVVIGTAQLCELALSTSAAGLFNRIPADMVDPTSFWRHGVSCAVLARGLAQLRRERNAERFFVGGLLHDIGRAILYVFAPGPAQHALFDAYENSQPLHDAERRALGFDHAAVGEALLEAWNLSECHREIVGRHHSPSDTSKFPTEAAIVHVADLMANALQMGSSGERLVPALDVRAWQHLEISLDALPGLIESGEHQIGDIVSILSQDSAK